MKLFLSSMAISAEQAQAFIKLVGKSPEETTLALIENAADVYDDSSTDWVDQNREAIQAHGFQVETIDLRTYVGEPDRLRQKLASKDAVWLGGGNTFYLRWILHKSEADVIIKELVANGTVYGGGSAGAIVAGPTLKYFEDADDPADSPEVILDGLHLTDTVVVPHVGNQKYGEAMKKIQALLKQDGFTVTSINDDQAVVISDNDIVVVPA